MEENNNEKTNEYTGEYGNSVEGVGKPQDGTYSYSYKGKDDSVTHSGDYYAGNSQTAQQNDYSSQNTGYQQNNYDSRNTGYQQNNYSSQNNGFNQNMGFQQGGGFGSDNMNQPGDNKKKKRGKSNDSYPVKILKYAGLAAVFGVVAAVCFEAVAFFSGNVLGLNKRNISTTTSKQIGSTTSATKPATGSVISGATDVSAIAEQTMPSVVAITSTTAGTAYYDLFGQQQQSQDSTSAGTGFIIGQNDKELLIATNNHVIDGAKTISVQFIDEEICEASVKGSDTSNDLAVVAVKTKDIKDSTMDKIRVADLGDSDDLKVGEMAIAIGNSLGYGQSVTVGYISAKNREITEQSENGGSGNKIEAIQTDAAINPGNSGGPLINLQGQVIGINSAKIASSSVEGVGYAIPISVATPIIDELKNKENLSDSEKGYLGISGRTVTEAASLYNIPTGVYVAEVAKGGAADKGGIKEGDIITAINNQSVTTIESLQEKANSYRKGTEVELTIQRSNNGAYEEQKVKVKLQGSSSLNGLSSDKKSSGNSNNDSNNSDNYNNGNSGSSGSDGNNDSNGSNGNNDSEQYGSDGSDGFGEFGNFFNQFGY